MSEYKIIPTKTEVLRIGGALNIRTYYQQGEVDFLIAFISGILQTLNGILFKEGELGYTKDGYSDINFIIDNDGNLVIQSNGNKTFSINSNGELIMEEIT
jgi:hypothetical protein